MTGVQTCALPIWLCVRLCQRFAELLDLVHSAVGGGKPDRRKLYAACLSKSAQDGEEQAVPYADWSAEKQAEYKLQAADLTTQGSAADTVSADMTQVDALSGATITSTAVTDIVNNSYFYVRPCAFASDTMLVAIGCVETASIAAAMDNN